MSSFDPRPYVLAAIAVVAAVVVLVPVALRPGYLVGVPALTTGAAEETEAEEEVRWRRTDRTT